MVDILAGQLRAEGAAVVGFDLPSAKVAIDALGYDAREVLPLVTAIEAGMVSGLNNARR